MASSQPSISLPVAITRLVLTRSAITAGCFAERNDGTLYRSDAVGEHWRRVDHGIEANGTMMTVAVARSDRRRIYCASRCGQVFGTEDAGASWREYTLPAGVLERVRAVACV